MLPHIGLDQVADETPRQRREDADAEMAVDALAGIARHLAGEVQLGQHRADLVEESAPGVGHPDSRPVPLEQRHAELVLEPPDPAADHRLPHAQRGGGLAEIEMLGRDQGGTEGDNVHGRPAGCCRRRGLRHDSET